MTRAQIDRRRALALAGFAGAAGVVGAARATTSGTASRIAPLLPEIYEPPTSLAVVADIYRRMTIPLMIDGKGPFPFVVDTGANQSVISAELASALELPVGPSAALNGVAGVEQTSSVIASIGLGRRRRVGVRLFVLPGAAIGGAGILGLDGLDRQRLVFDFAGQRLRLEPGGLKARDVGDVDLQAHRRDGQLTLVDADLSGIRIVAFIDSGAQNTIGNPALEHLARIRRPKNGWMEAPVISVTGQTTPAVMSDLPGLRLGGVSFSHWPVAFADLHVFRMWGLTDQPAVLIGIDVLSRFQQVSLDFIAQVVRFRPPDHPVLRVEEG